MVIHQLGHDPQVIAAGRRVNEYIPTFIAKRLVQTLIEQGKNPGISKVLVMGITFKENVSDIRNSKVADLIMELKGYSIEVHVVDEFASVAEVAQEYGITLIEKANGPYDAIVISIGHDSYKGLKKVDIVALSNGEPIVFDIKSVLNASDYTNYWKL